MQVQDGLCVCILINSSSLLHKTIESPIVERYVFKFCTTFSSTLFTNIKNSVQYPKRNTSIFYEANASKIFCLIL